MKDTYKNKVARTIVLLIISIVLSVFALVNVDGFILPAFMYIVMSSISIFLILIWNKFGKKDDFIGIGNRYFFDIAIGTVLAIGIILLQSLNIIGSLLTPYIPSSISISDVGRIILQIFDAGVIEGILFTGIISVFFDDKLKSFGIDPPLWLAIIFGGLVAGVFHWTAYDLSSGLSFGAFISAVIIFTVWGFVTFYWARSLTPMIICHMILNGYILNKQFNWINLGITPGINSLILPIATFISVSMLSILWIPQLNSIKNLKNGLERKEKKEKLIRI